MMWALRGIIGRQEIGIDGMLYQVSFAPPEVGAKRLGEILNRGSIEQLTATVPAALTANPGTGRVARTSSRIAGTCSHREPLSEPSPPSSVIR